MPSKQKDGAGKKKKRSGDKSDNRYSEKAAEKIGEVMKKFKAGTLESGSGEKVTDRKQAIAIGISEARKKGYKTPQEPAKKDGDKP